MRRFWNEIQEHRLGSGLFLAYWASAYALNIVRWHAPEDTADIVPPVLLLHALLPLVAGLLAARWRGPHRGRMLDGMVAGATVMLADVVLIFLYDALKFSGSNSPGGGDEVMEIPAWLAVASLVGAALGSIGAAGAAVFGGRIPPAERERTAALPGRVLLIASTLAFSVAVALPIAVIAPVAADTSPGATPDRAVSALGIITVLDAYAGVTFLIATWAKTRRANRPIAAITALLVIALGAVLAAAGSAAVGHSHMGLEAVGLIVCAFGNLSAGILALVAVFRRSETVE